MQFLVCQAISCRLGAWNAYTNWARRWQDQQTMTSICYHKSAAVLTSTTCSLNKNDTCHRSGYCTGFRVVMWIFVQSTTVSVNNTDA